MTVFFRSKYVADPIPFSYPDFCADRLDLSLVNHHISKDNCDVFVDSEIVCLAMLSQTSVSVKEKTEVPVALKSK